MFRNYIKIAFRNLLKHKGYSIINITGLAIGMAACILLFIVVRYENSYDRFYPGHDQIARIITEDLDPDGMDYTPGIPYPLKEVVATALPDLPMGFYNDHSGSQISVLGNNGGAAQAKFIEDKGLGMVEPGFLRIFEQQWLAGSPDVLEAPNMSVLTKSIAEKYFGTWQQAMGQLISIDNRHTMKVTGIIQDPPVHSDIPLRVISSFETIRQRPDYHYDPHWGNLSSSMQLYVKLKTAADSVRVNKVLLKISKDQYEQNGRMERAHYLQALTTLHSDNRFGNFGDHTTSQATLWTLSLIGILIILMACINFVNLNTAKAVSRSKEVGVRKVMGGSRAQLFWQMMGETAVLVGIALVLALAIAWAAMPFLKQLVSIQEKLPLFTRDTIPFLAIVSLLVILLSGSYPALVLSGFRPALALKNKITSASIGGIPIRRALVVVQFAMAQVLVIATIVSISQMNFVRNMELGFNKNALLVLNGRTDSTALSRQAAFKAALLQLPGVKAVSFNSDVPSSDNNSASNFNFDHHANDEKFAIFLKYADADYFKTFDLRFLAGKAYDPGDTARTVVVNETFLEKFAIKDPQQVLGKEVRIGGGRWLPVSGVVKDFKTNSLRENIKPLIISIHRRRFTETAIKLQTANIVQTNTAIRKIWDQHYPEYAYDSFFVDESIANFYRQEEQLETLYKIFAGLAIFISCLGLYGLVSFMAVQKTKEVGIRKVLGASVGNIVYLFSREFTLLISLAFIIATPVAWWVMNQWLQDFTYRIRIGIGVFLLAITFSLIIAWITVGYKAIRAALANPVKSLRNE
ncbi:MAG: ABC transporter permease [Candidatus Pseudobacter hemicellulosilyticus]|uniref:ABC transporter permease n=1 Tax=Candidatus Pseudobacter hemicellulosilyticus TaxID=3121375 RepID=A0AAJ6BF81_9BACT|nr:MAG: ABC transporter permease [Pseudobacter sp.]